MNYARVLRPGVVLLVMFLMVCGVQTAGAHEDGASATPPSTCSGVGVGIRIFPFRADGTTPVTSASIVSNCEALVFKSDITYQAGGTCAFEGGTFTLTTPDNVVHTIGSPTTTPVPCVGGTSNDPNSATLNMGRGLCAGSNTSFPVPLSSFNYTVRDQDIVSASCQGGSEPPNTPCSKTTPCTMGGTCVGEIDVSATYTGSFNHTAATDTRGGTASNMQPLTVVICPESANGCEEKKCDTTTFQCVTNENTCSTLTNGCERNGCDANSPTFNTCFKDTNTCSTLTNGCERNGCDANSATFNTCFKDTNTCSTLTNGCERNGCDANQPAFNTCFHDTNTCSTLTNGCERNGCDANQPAFLQHLLPQHQYLLDAHQRL